MAEQNFEKSINELEKIVSKLESGDLSLDEMLKLFEEGVGISKKCSKILDDAEKKINQITKKDGEFTKKEFVLSEE
jgi:exodeoxyribonuclease VII small subunit